jgi:hypothetical protein
MVHITTELTKPNLQHNLSWKCIYTIAISKAAHSKAQDCSRSLVGIAGSNTSRGMDLRICEYWMLSGINLCDGPIPRPEVSYRVCVTLSAIRCNNSPSCLRSVGRRGWTKKAYIILGKARSLVLRPCVSSLIVRNRQIWHLKPLL